MIAREQRRPDVVRRRRNFVIARRFVEPDRLVFLDESGAKTNMTRRYGRAPVGERCNFYTVHGHWKTTTMVSAIRRTGVIAPATLLLDGPMNAATFLGYVERCLSPALRPGEIVVMDNLGSHKAAGVEKSIERAGAS
ncbi:MAG: transposase, partial [Phycisphaerales bacterium]|nr:transposase [Phycisphaerales bacterium]